MISDTRFISIFSDASFCHDTGAAGWGCWIGYREGYGITDGGPLTGAVDAAHAELMAMKCAVLRAAADPDVSLNENNVMLFLQSDNLQVLSALRCALRCSDKPYRDRHCGAIVPIMSVLPAVWVVHLNIIAEALRGVRVVTRHVKGHSGRPEGRYRVNVRCDRIAKHHMHAQRALIQS